MFLRDCSDVWEWEREGNQVDRNLRISPTTFDQRTHLKLTNGNRPGF